MLCEAGKAAEPSRGPSARLPAVGLTLRETTQEDLGAVLSLESDPDVAPWITRWPAERHRRAISDTDEAHMTLFGGPAFGLPPPRRSEPRESLSRAAQNRAVSPRRGPRPSRARPGAPPRVRGVRLDVFEVNTRAQRLYERASFKPGGVLHGAHLLPDGSFASLRLMSTTRSDWEARSAASPVA
jgi:hypothetical protein